MKTKLILLFAAALFLCAHGRIAAQQPNQTYAITNARIVTVSGPVIEKGTIVIRNGLIDAVGANVSAPADAQVIDATGMTVYPGFIDALTNLGLQSQQTPRPAGGAATASQPAQQAQQQPASNSNYPAGLRPEESAFDELRAGDAQFESARGAGFTSALTVGRTGIFNGRSALINLAGDSASAIVVKAPFAMHFSFRTIGGGQYPGSLLGTFSAFRQMLLDARRLQRLEKQYAADPRGLPRPPVDRSLEALYPVIDRQMPIVFNAQSEKEIIRALDLAKEFDLRAIIAGGQEAWKVADRLKAQDVPVLLSLNFPKRTTSASADADPEPLDVLRLRAEVPKNAARLAQAGVRFAFQSDGARSIADFFANAGKAVENGLSRDAAVRAMTLGSAEILGVDDRLGSIETGKIANIAVVKGDLFAKNRFVSRVFVDGRMFEMKEPPKRDAPNGGRAASPDNTGIANVGGSFAITIDIPGQPLQGTLNLIQQAAIVTGTLQSPLGTTQIKDGRATADGFTFSATVEFGGSVIEIKVAGKVTGNEISGTIDSPQGVVPFAGTRNP
ncbi:MAG: amidohydrolase family protein [Pyrinomonadaceae bacterium]